MLQRLILLLMMMVLFVGCPSSDSKDSPAAANDSAADDGDDLADAGDDDDDDDDDDDEEEEDDSIRYSYTTNESAITLSCNNCEEPDLSFLAMSTTNGEGCDGFDPSFLTENSGPPEGFMDDLDEALTIMINGAGAGAGNSHSFSTMFGAFDLECMMTSGDPMNECGIAVSTETDMLLFVIDLGEETAQYYCLDDEDLPESLDGLEVDLDADFIDAI